VRNLRRTCQRVASSGASRRELGQLAASVRRGHTSRDASVGTGAGLGADMGAAMGADMAPVRTGALGVAMMLHVQRRSRASCERDNPVEMQFLSG
jgi:hypothetical protein